MPSDQDAKKTLLVYIHGLNDYDRDRNLELLTSGLQAFMADHNMGFEANGDTSDDSGRPTRFVKAKTGEVLDIDMVFWGDMRRRFSAKSSLDKLKSGASLFLFWLVSPLWGQMLRTTQSRLLAGIVFTLVVFGLWYFSTLVTVAAAPDQLPDFLQQPARDFAAAVQSAWIWVVALVVLQIIPANQMLDIVYSVQCYLREPEMRMRVRGRLSNRLARADSSGAYDQIVVVAHSFGTVVAIEVLDNFHFQTPARVVTLGSPVEVVAARHGPLRQSIEAAARNATLVRWDDVISDQDWLCTPVPAPADAAHFKSRPLVEKVDFSARLSGASHEMYFYSDDVFRLILGTLE